MLTDEQRKNRVNGIGASDSPVIMGYSSYKTPYQLYLEKTGIITPEDEVTDLQYWGNRIEPLIVQRFGEVNNVEIEFPDTIYHPDYPFIFANLDGYIPSMDAVVEAKMANSFMRKEWDSAYEDGIPLTYLIQIAKQVAVKNASKGFCAVLIGGYEYMQFTYERDVELEKLILESDLKFWDCVQRRIEPEPISITDCRLKYNNPKPDLMAEATFKAKQDYASLMNVKMELKRLSDKEEHYKMKLMQHMGNAEYLVDLEGEILATWKANKKGTRVFTLKG